MFVRALAGGLACAQAAALFVCTALASPAAAAAPADGITFGGLTWGETRRGVRAELASGGFTLIASTPDDFYRGTVDGNGATVTCVFTPSDELVFVRVIFDAGANAAALDASLTQRYGKAASCNEDATQCRWERNGATVAFVASGDPYAPAHDASLEYSAGGDLAERYDQQINNKQFDRGEKTDL
jgi:hypothetical protein